MSTDSNQTVGSPYAGQQARQSPYPLQQQGIMNSAATAQETALSSGAGMSFVAPAGATSAPPQCSGLRIRRHQRQVRWPRRRARSPTPGKTAVNSTHFKSQYADLSAGLNSIRAALSANSIAIVQTTRMEGDVLDAQQHARSCLRPVDRLAMAGVQASSPAPGHRLGVNSTPGAATPLFALVGIAGEGEDDDANAATSHDPVIDVDADLVYVETLIRDTESDLGKFLETVGAPAIDKMNVSQFKKGVGLLEAKKRRAAK